MERLPGGGSRFLDKEAKDVSAFRNNRPSGSRWLSSLLPWRKLLYCWQELFCPEGQTAAWEGCQPGREWWVGRWNYSKLPLRISRKDSSLQQSEKIWNRKGVGELGQRDYEEQEWNQFIVLLFLSHRPDRWHRGGKPWHGGGKQVWFLVWAAVAPATRVIGCKSPV